MAQYEELRSGLEVPGWTILNYHDDYSESFHQALTSTRRENSSYALLFYGVMAVGAGFASVTLFIVILRFGKSVYVWGKTLLFHKAPTGQVTQAIQRKRPLRALLRQAMLLLCSTSLAAGFIVAASQQMDAIKYSRQSEALRQERVQILNNFPVGDSQALRTEQLVERYLRLVEAYKSLESLKKKYPSATPKPGIETDYVSSPIQQAFATDPFAADHFGLRFPTESWLVLVALTFLGGILAVACYVLFELRARSAGIQRAPGARSRSVVDFLYSRKTIEEVFDPIIADWRLEYFEALHQKKVWKARWISVRYAYSFLVAIGLSRVFSFFKVFTRAGK